MAPIFDMALFDGLVRPSLWDAYTGWVRVGAEQGGAVRVGRTWPRPAVSCSVRALHSLTAPCHTTTLETPFGTPLPQGLDFVWPFLMHYPRDRIGVIDEVCMLHPHSAESKGTGEGSIYAALARVAPYGEGLGRGQRVGRGGGGASRYTGRAAGTPPSRLDPSCPPPCRRAGRGGAARRPIQLLPFRGAGVGPALPPH